MGNAEFDDLHDFRCEKLTLNGDEKDVFWKGSGPGVILLTEIPGITPEVADFDEELLQLDSPWLCQTSLGNPAAHTAMPMH